MMSWFILRLDMFSSACSFFFTNSTFLFDCTLDVYSLSISRSSFLSLSFSFLITKFCSLATMNCSTFSLTFCIFMFITLAFSFYSLSTFFLRLMKTSSLTFLFCLSSFSLAYCSGPNSSFKNCLRYFSLLISLVSISCSLLAWLSYTDLSLVS
jgi:hypothetical protein